MSAVIDDQCGILKMKCRLFIIFSNNLKLKVKILWNASHVILILFKQKNLSFSRIEASHEVSLKIIFKFERHILRLTTFKSVCKIQNYIQEEFPFSYILWKAVFEKVCSVKGKRGFS